MNVSGHLGHVMQQQTDRELLDSYVAERSEAAFAELAARYSPLVYRACWRVLGNASDAEEAAQAAFLVLARKADSLRQEGHLNGWLHRVARLTALQALRGRGDRERRQEQAAVLHESVVEAVPAAERELVLQALDAELDGLSAILREALVLRYLRGCSEQEAAAQAGCPVGTMKWRASEGIAKLRARLTKRGVTLSGASLAGLLAAEASTAIPETLLPSILATVKGLAATAAAGTTTSTTAGMLAKGAMKTMFMAKVKMAAMVTTAAIAVGGAGVTTYVALAKEPPPPPPVVAVPTTLAVAPAPVVYPDAESELAAQLAKPEAIVVRRESAVNWIYGRTYRYGLDCSWADDFWNFDQLITLVHRGTLRECIEKLATTAGIRVSFDAGLVRFWRPAAPEKIRELAARLASPNEQERCIAAWRLGRLNDPAATELLLKPMLDDPSEAVRHWAVRSLERRQIVVGRPTLLPLEPQGIVRAEWVARAIASENPTLRRLGFEAAGVWRTLPADGKPFLDLLTADTQRFPDSELQGLAAWALGRCRHAQARTALTDLAGKKQWSQRTVISALKRLGVGDFPERMMNQLQNGPSKADRDTAAMALGQLGCQEAEKSLLEAKAKDLVSAAVADTALNTLVAARPATVEELVIRIRQDKTGDYLLYRLEFINQLAALGTPEAHEALFKLATEGKVWSRQALGSLVTLGDERASELVFRAAAQANDEECAFALYLLPKLDGADIAERRREVLLAALRTPGRAESVRARAAMALGTLGDDRAVPELVNACGENKGAFGMAAIEALGRIGTPSAREALFSLFVEDPFRTGRAIQALLADAGVAARIADIIWSKRHADDQWHFFGFRDYSPEFADALMPFLKRANSAEQARIIGWGKNSPEVVPLAIRLMAEGQTPEERRAAVVVLGGNSFVGSAGTVDPRVRPVATERLTEEQDARTLLGLASALSAFPLDPKNVETLLARAAPGKDWDERAYAVRALGLLKANVAVDPLLKMLDETPDADAVKSGKYAGLKRAVLETLGRIGDRKAVDAAIRMLEDSDPGVRVRAVMCLGDLKDRRAVAPLLQALERGKPGSRGSEIKALAQLEDERVLPALLQILEGSDPQDASFAALTLRTSCFAARSEVVAALAKYNKR